jgi:hypothetical protein
MSPTIGICRAYRSIDPMGNWPEWKKVLAGVAPEYCNSGETNKYQRTIRGETLDIYDILLAYGVTSPPLQHLIKKALMAGQRGHKDRMTDLKEILSAAQRAVEMEEN